LSDATSFFQQIGDCEADYAGLFSENGQISVIFQSFNTIATEKNERVISIS
jgi:hypothetical protein